MVATAPLRFLLTLPFLRRLVHSREAGEEFLKQSHRQQRTSHMWSRRGRFGCLAHA